MTFELREQEYAVTFTIRFATHFLRLRCGVYGRSLVCGNVRFIAAGQSDVEATEDGYYRQATAISMTGGCISCHAGFFNQPSKAQKYSGLVISIPVTPEE